MNLFTGWRMRRKAAVVDTSEVAREYRAREAILVRDLAREWGTTEEVVRWSVTGGQEVIQQDFARAVADAAPEPEAGEPTPSRGRSRKLTTREVLAIRRAYAAGGSTQQDLARAYGIPLSLTQRVLRGDAYATAGGPLAIPRKRRSRREAEA